MHERLIGLIYRPVWAIMTKHQLTDRRSKVDQTFRRQFIDDVVTAFDEAAITILGLAHSVQSSLPAPQQIGTCDADVPEGAVINQSVDRHLLSPMVLDARRTPVVMSGRCAIPAQQQWIIRVDVRHEWQATVMVGDAINQTHPVADHALGGVMPGVVQT